MILVLEVCLLFPLIPKNTLIALHLTLQWWFNDVRVMKNWILRILDENRRNFKLFAKNPRNMRLWWVFWLIVKGNYYYNEHRKFQVHSTNVFLLGAKTNIARWQPSPSTPNFDSLPYPYLRAGLISRAVKTYFDRKAVKTRLKPVKMWSKPKTQEHVPRVVKEPC